MGQNWLAWRHSRDDVSGAEGEELLGYLRSCLSLGWGVGEGAPYLEQATLDRPFRPLGQGEAKNIL